MLNLHHYIFIRFREERNKGKGAKKKEKKRSADAQKQLGVPKHERLDRVDDARDHVRHDDDRDDELEQFLGAPDAFEVATGEGEG